jgi:hypothetical protein
MVSDWILTELPSWWVSPLKAGPVGGRLRRPSSRRQRRDGHRGTDPTWTQPAPTQQRHRNVVPTGPWGYPARGALRGLPIRSGSNFSSHHVAGGLLGSCDGDPLVALPQKLDWPFSFISSATSSNTWSILAVTFSKMYSFRSWKAAATLSAPRALVIFLSRSTTSSL